MKEFDEIIDFINKQIEILKQNNWLNSYLLVQRLYIESEGMI